ncbi:carbohydrate ABC transporter permease [Schinkia azotoformans]|uniref:carbohydrate ABC transporter permease n=1 Tax=Schinkia azotoformans TaxID=1454 RepID=UPI002DBD42F0|nr:sugar ABC transporter permease [Schinkia azotoformans]MEC1718610.1 sugar ABC transporter permease [Schinkia azotoformans]MEC1743592.1 sugar ABC transporter permease [Schinkia azotoformans]MEC1748235.1 sugar ABC transporter permease [Schinkia azotoformans]MEC1759493.1 sugar ABC transporter permease [Schinkia azotoformans]MEC1768539.1 sugar ABC transporter permease [Schinkia azotoformans]
MKRLRFKEFLFIVPVILLIAVFSLWPVIQSFTYTFFDYRLNDQTKAGLYLSEQFNFELYDETQMYLKMFLNEDKKSVNDPKMTKDIDLLITRLNAVETQFEGRDGVQKINDEEKEVFLTLSKEAKTVISTLTENYDTPNKENLPLIVEDIENSIIPSNFIGVEAYKKALADNRLQTALVNTFVFTIVSVFLELILGLALALIMNKAIVGQGLVRTTSLIPWAIPTAVAALMWSYLYDGSSGIVAHLFEMIGIVGDSRDLLLSGSGAMFSTIIADVWKTTPYMALLLLAGLQNIPKSLYEAASIDGANRVQSFFQVTLPLLKPSILVALLFRTLDAFRVFDLIYVLTGGGPGGATETLSIYGYKAMFAQTNFGYGSVIVMIMFVCVALIAIVYVKILGANLMDKS